MMPGGSDGVATAGLVGRTPGGVVVATTRFVCQGSCRARLAALGCLVLEAGQPCATHFTFKCLTTMVVVL